MWYQLVLITNLGVITPLAQFDNQGSCLREQAMLTKTSQYSAACLPTQSPADLQRQIEVTTKILLDTVKKLQAETK